MAAATAAALAIAGASVAHADPDGDSGPEAIESGPATETQAQPLPQADGRSEVFVQFDVMPGIEAARADGVPVDDGAALAPNARLQRSGSTAMSDASAQVQQLAQAVLSELSDPTELYTTEYGIAGLAVEADAAELQALTDLDGVAGVVPLPKMEPASAAANAHTGVVDVWQNLQQYGDGTTIAVIDSGVDYTHPTFDPDAEAYPTAEGSLAEEVDWPKGNVVGGWDFVGLNYSGGAGSPEAAPDPNPIDEAEGLCSPPPNVGLAGGHGTHVAGIAAGQGVDAEGQTFTGDYQDLSAADLEDFEVAPGSAPEANIIALKVFGCAGSTAYAMAAMEWVLAYNAGEPVDGAPAPQEREFIDVVNLSLGSVFGLPEDPQNAVVQQLTEQGVVVVIAAGNSGDTVSVGGSPAAAPSSLAVANAATGQQFFDGLEVNVAGSEEVQVQRGQFSVEYNEPSWEGSMPLVALDADEIEPGPGISDLDYLSGCGPFSASDAAVIDGNVLMLAWDDDVALPCGSAARFDNAFAAGATGVVLTGTVDTFTAGIAGNADIPGFQLTASALEPIADYAPETGAITLLDDFEVRFNFELERVDSEVFPNLTDTLNPSSSRGQHGMMGVVKPDLAAPGTLIANAEVGSGGVAVMSGTSMAAPHAAGVAALTVAQKDESWTAGEIKANLMNTATTSIVTERDDDGTATGPAFGPQRVGAGGINAEAALDNDVVAFDADDPELVSVNFGPIEVGDESLELTRTIQVDNKGEAAQTLDVSYSEQAGIPGVEYSLSASSAQVPAGGSASVDLTLSVSDPSALAKSMDPATSPTDHLLAGVPKEFLATAMGWVEFSGAPQTPLRVPVNATVRPFASIAGADVEFGEDEATAPLALSGRGLDQGGASGAYQSIVVPLELAATSEQGEYPEGSIYGGGDLAAVGTSSYTVPDAAGEQVPFVGFGIATHGQWNTLGERVRFGVFVDRPEGVYSIVTSKPVSGPTRGDVTLVQVIPPGEDGQVLSRQIHGVPATVDTNTFDTNVTFLPVALQDLGFSEEEIANGEVSFDYTVESLVQHGENRADFVEGLSWSQDAAVTFGTGVGALYPSADDTQIPVTLPQGGEVAPAVAQDSSSQDSSTQDSNAQGAAGQSGQASIIAANTVQPLAVEERGDLLLLHLHNEAGARYEVVSMTQEVAEEPEPTPTPTPTESEDPEPTEPEDPTPTESSSPSPSDSEDPTPSQAPTDGGEKPGPLPGTGASVLLLAVLAAAALGIGTWLTARRRRSLG